MSSSLRARTAARSSFLANSAQDIMAICPSRANAAGPSRTRRPPLRPLLRTTPTFRPHLAFRSPLRSDRRAEAGLSCAERSGSQIFGGGGQLLVFRRHSDQGSGNGLKAGVVETLNGTFEDERRSRKHDRRAGDLRNACRRRRIVHVDGICRSIWTDNAEQAHPFERAEAPDLDCAPLAINHTCRPIARECRAG